jgi:hypothetical protein
MLIPNFYILLGVDHHRVVTLGFLMQPVPFDGEFYGVFCLILKSVGVDIAQHEVKWVVHWLHVYRAKEYTVLPHIHVYFWG